MKKGVLEDVGIKRIGFDEYRWWRCRDCGTEFPAGVTWGAPTCAGHVIGLCPWCRQDSVPWRNGRGK